MMALQLLPILQVIVILFTPSTLAYPSRIYGTKRYGRSSFPHRLTSLDPYQSQQHYPNYYKLYPYSQSYPSAADSYYYPQDSYPVYYPPARTSKYEVYQAVLPYYYQEPITRPAYYGYADPMIDMQEEMIQEAEREQREKNQPIGHEIMYETDNDNEALEDANAAFLQNLIVSQMYQDSLTKNSNKDQRYDDQYSYDYDEGTTSESSYGKWEDVPYDKPSNKEDDDVRELKQLTKQKQKQKLRTQKGTNNKDDIHWFQKNSYKNQEKRSSSNNLPEGVMVYTDRKPIVKTVDAITQAAPTGMEQPKRDARGQKEEVLMRPATPVRHPFSNSVLEMMSKNENGHRKRAAAPSVYDTIKQMLEAEKNLEDKELEKLRPQMKKRVITSDESLTRQLSLLKKSQ